jgi:hypothetical protein
MVSTERMRLRMSACQPCEMSSLRYIFSITTEARRKPIETPCRGGELPFFYRFLLNVNIARAGPQAQQRPAAANFADDRLASVLHPALHGHGEWSVHVERARTS